MNSIRTNREVYGEEFHFLTGMESVALSRASRAFKFEAKLYTLGGQNLSAVLRDS